MSEINVKNLTAEEKAALLAELQADASNSRIQKREAYEALRSQFIPNRSLGPLSSGDVKVFSCSPESKECLPLIHGSHKA